MAMLLWRWTTLRKQMSPLKCYTVSHLSLQIGGSGTLTLQETGAFLHIKALSAEYGSSTSAKSIQPCKLTLDKI